MGKCVSKHPSALTIALSEQDLATANKIWSKFAESNEYIALGEEYGNQLYGQQNVGNKAEDTTKTPQKQQPQQQEEKQQKQLKNHQKKLKQLKQHHQRPQQQHRVKLQTIIKKNDNVGAFPGNVNNNDNDSDDCSGYDIHGKDYDDNDDVDGDYYDTKEAKIVETSNEVKRTKNLTMIMTPTSIGFVRAGANNVAGDNAESTTKKLDLEKELKRKARKVVKHDDGHIVGKIVEKKISNNNTSNGRNNRNIDKSTTNINNSNNNSSNIISSTTTNKNKIDRGNKNHDLPSYYLLLQGIHVQQQQENEQHPPEHSHLKFQQQQQHIVEDVNNNETVSSKELSKKESRHNNNNQHYYTNIKLNEKSLYCRKSEKSILKNKHNKQLTIISGTENGPNRNVEYDDNIFQHQEQEEVSEGLQCQQKQIMFYAKRSLALNFWTHIQGQSESKKLFKKSAGNSAGTLETKGTAMSFGFRKKLNTTPKKTKKQKDSDGSSKKQDECNNLSGDSVIYTDGGGDNGVAGRRRGDARPFLEQRNDNNGNTDHKTNIHFEKMGAVVAAKSHNQGAAAYGEQQQYRPGAESRFGFKGSTLVRPASTGITSRYQSGDELHANLENNNVDGVGGSQRNLPYKSNLKRRSKSAHSTRSMASNQCIDANFEDGKDAAAAPKIAQPKTITFNLNHNTIEYQRRQFFEQTPPAVHTASNSRGMHYNLINTGMHTNVIVRPIARPAPAPVTFTKFTLQTTSLPKPEYPVPIRVSTTHASGPPLAVGSAPVSASSAQFMGGRVKEVGVEHMDQKTVKQMANSTRRGFNGTREISADSGIASLDITLGGDSSTSSGGGGGSGRARTSSPKRSRSRPRNLQMVMNGRHKFEVRDLDDPFSNESSLVEPLALPKLPSEHQTMPLPLSGLVRSNTVLSREAFMKSNSNAAKTEKEDEITTDKRDECDASQAPLSGDINQQVMKQSSEDTDSIEEEKLYIDSSTSEKHAKKHYKFRDINTYSSKTSSAASSQASSWCNAGESLANKDCISLSFSSSEDSNKLNHQLQHKPIHLPDTPPEGDDDLSTILNTDIQLSSISSTSDPLPAVLFQTKHRQNKKLTSQQKPSSVSHLEMGQERPQYLYDSALSESKFAEIAAAGSEYLLDDETSPTDSLVSSTDSDDAACKRQKHKINEEIQEKDIDEISPELELGSPASPGTPTHASRSLSLSECGNLIDDEIADQPALLFNNESGAEHSGASHKGHSDTPTLMETIGGNSSIHSLKSQSKGRSALQQAIELSLRTPISLRRAVMNHAESLDTLSPCESICSDDLMMDFDVTSSLDSIDKSTSIKSRSGSDLNQLDESNLFAQLDRKGTDVMKELNTILRVHARNTDKETGFAQLPARATRLLNRSRIQQQCQISSADSESPKSTNSVQHRSAASRGSTSTSSLQHSGREAHSSSDDLMLYDKSFRNAMIQDVLQFKRQLLRLRRILQEDEDYLKRTETLNPFETDNGQLFASCGLDSKLLDDIDLASLTSSTTDDPLQELADLRRQVVYLQGQVDDRDRTIRLQRNLIEKLESQKVAPVLSTAEGNKECINMATQTERTRPLSIGPDGLSRSKPEFTSYTTFFPITRSSDSATIIQQHNPPTTTTNQTRRHTIISATFTNYNHLPQSAATVARRRASIGWERQQQGSETTKSTTSIKKMPTTAYKPVKITLIGEPIQSKLAATKYTNIESRNNTSNNTGNKNSNSTTNNNSSGYINSNGESNSNNCNKSHNGESNGHSNCINRLNGYHQKHCYNATSSNNIYDQKCPTATLDDSKKMGRNGLYTETNGCVNVPSKALSNVNQEQQQQQHRYQQLQQHLHQQQQFLKYQQQQQQQKHHYTNSNISSTNHCNGQQPTVTIV